MVRSGARSGVRRGEKTTLAWRLGGLVMVQV